MKKTLLALLAGSFAAASQAGALIDLAAEAGRPAANDMVRARSAGLLPLASL